VNKSFDLTTHVNVTRRSTGDNKRIKFNNL